jgi:hypothetical protein
MTAGIDVTTKTLQRSRIWIVIGVFGLLTSACSSDVEILSAAASGDGTWLELSLNSCKRTYDVSVEEADGVSVHVVDANSKSPIQLGGKTVPMYGRSRCRSRWAIVRSSTPQPGMKSRHL